MHETEKTLQTLHLHYRVRVLIAETWMQSLLLRQTSILLVGVGVEEFAAANGVAVLLLAAGVARNRCAIAEPMLSARNRRNWHFDLLICSGLCVRIFAESTEVEVASRADEHCQQQDDDSGNQQTPSPRNEICVAGATPRLQHPLAVVSVAACVIAVIGEVFGNRMIDMRFECAVGSDCDLAKCTANKPQKTDRK